MQRADSATVFRGPDSPELLAAQAMYQPAKRHQPFPGVPGSQWAEARQPVTQPGYWAGPQQACHPAGHQRKTAYVAAPAEPSAHAARPAARRTTPTPDLQAKRKIRRARRQERNAAMDYTELIGRLEHLITEQGGPQNVATDAIVRLYQVGVAPMFRALRDAVRGPADRSMANGAVCSGTSCGRSSR